MDYYHKYGDWIRMLSQGEDGTQRYLNPADIYLQPGYKIEVFAEGLDSPSSIHFTQEGELLIADTGYTTNNPKVSKLVDDHFEVLADDFNVPLIGINSKAKDIYVSHRGSITVVKEDGTKRDIITGLPSYGDYSNSRVVFGPDDRIYFGIGTATNSGVVGTDNLWVEEYPHFHDESGSYIMLNGQNFATVNMLIDTAQELTYTGAFSPYGVPNIPFEVRKGILKASGSILKSKLNGEEMELVAWGLRSISYLQFDSGNRLFASNNGFDIRGSRPIANAPDELYIITSKLWYGWPDYAGGDPVTDARFKPEGAEQPQFLMSSHPNVPPRPYAAFPPNSTIIGFDFNKNRSFGQVGDIYIAEFGNISPRTYSDSMIQYAGIGHRISKVDASTGSVSTFAINRSGFSSTITREGGFGRPSDIAFGPDGAMYITDMGINTIENPNIFIPKTGVIWKISRTE